jgi:hypothetical protein
VAGGGGVFVPVQYPVSSGTTTTICGTTVSGKWVLFPGTQVPEPGKTGFQGYLVNMTAPGTPTIPNTDYKLQYWVTSANTGCCAVGPTPFVTCAVTAGLPYRFIAHFKVGKAPPSGTVIELRGTWTPP